MNFINELFKIFLLDLQLLRSLDNFIVILDNIGIIKYFKIRKCFFCELVRKNETKISKSYIKY